MKEEASKYDIQHFNYLKLEYEINGMYNTP